MQSHKFGAYIAYFERIASEHKLIKHTLKEKHFFRFELDEVLSGLPHKLNFPALILEGYSFEFVDKLSDNPIKKRNSAFILLDHVPDIGNYNDMHRIWDKLEEIGDDILARIRTERRKPVSPIRDFSITSVEGTLLAVEHNNIRGVRYTFTIDSNFCQEMDTSKWSFLYKLSWSGAVCVKQSYTLSLAWSDLVCVKESYAFSLAWNDLICVKSEPTPSPDISLVWSDLICVKQTLAIGDMFAGGVVFYILQPGDPGYAQGQHKGFIAAMNDLDLMPWGPTDTFVHNTSEELGTGCDNSTEIYSKLGELGYDYAAKACLNHISNGLEGWCLPSKNELYKLYLVKTQIPGIAQNGYYWSSTEYPETTAWNAWCVNFDTGQMLATYQKNINHRVRPIRPFTIINNP